MSKMNGMEVAFQTQNPAPANWLLKKYEDDGENFFLGKFRVTGWVASIQERHNTETNNHFLFCSEFPADWRMKLVETEQLGLGCKHLNFAGHSRLFHIHQSFEDVATLNQLSNAHWNRQKIEIEGEVVFMQALDPEMQKTFFDGFDNTCKCPVVSIDRISLARPKPSLARRLAREVVETYTGRSARF